MNKRKANVTHDTYADAWYVKLRSGKSVKQIEQRCTVVWDLDKEGRTIGFEVLEGNNEYVSV